MYCILVITYNIINIECAIGKMSYMEVMELFNSLESNLPHEVEEVKHKFHEQFNNSKKFKHNKNILSENSKITIISLK